MLRIRGTSRDGQVVRLRSAKCTIGSSPDATLRLVARCVRPIHCLILRGEGGTFIRRWSGDTLLNGGQFSEAPLSPGDRIAVGPIELEVVDPSEPCPSDRGEPSSSARFQDAIHHVLVQTKLVEQRADELQRQQEACLHRCEELEQLARQLEARRAAPIAAEVETQAKTSESNSQDDRLRLAESPIARETKQEKPSGRAPLESAEVFRRMGIAIPEDNEDSPQPGQTAAETQTDTLAAEAPPTDRPSSEEESLDDYMSRLMERVRDRSWKVGLPGTPKTAAEARQSASPPAETKPVEKPLAPGGLLPLSVTPGKKVDLTKLRALANLSAKQAIHTHTQKQIRGLSRGKLVVTLAAGLAGGLLVLLSRLLPVGEFALYAGALGLLAAIVWGMQYAVLTGRLYIGRKGALQWNSLPAEDAPLAKPQEQKGEVEEAPQE
jgi:hypothetical protein